MKSNQTLKAARNKANAGFSLVELLLVTVIFSIIFLTISRVMMTTVKSDARLTEQSEASTRNSVITGVLQRDFKNPLQLFYGSPVSMNGTFPIPFAPHSDYQLSPGSALRVSSNNPQLLYSTAVLEIGEATARFTIPATSGAIIGWRTTLSEGGTKYSQMQVTRTSSVNRRTFTVSSQTGTETSGQIGAATRFEARIENLPSPYGCRVGFYAVEAFQLTLLARSTGSCPAMPLEITAEVTETGGSLTGEMFGSFAMPAGSQRLAPLPYVGVTQIQTPIFINSENGDLILFRAENSTDKTFINDPVTFQAGQSKNLTAKIPTRGAYKPGDYVFIVDYAGARSVIASVDSVAFSLDALELTVTPVSSQSNAAWGFFYSRPEDFAGAQFPSGAEIIHLAPPTAYRFLPADKLIVRREGTGLWDTVAPGVSAFNVALSAGALNIEILANTEGVETYNTQPVQRTYLSIPIK